MKQILESYTSVELKKFISATGLTNYSRLNKDGLIGMMISNKHLFDNIPMKPQKELPKKIRISKLTKMVNQEFKKNRFVNYKEKKEPAPVKKQYTHDELKETISKHKSSIENNKKLTPKNPVEILTKKGRRKKYQVNKMENKKDVSLIF